MLPDALHFVFAVFKIERFLIDVKAQGAFAYRPIYPYTHSLAGMAVMGLLLAAFRFAQTKKVKEALILAAMPLSHFILEIPGHRGDIILLPTLQETLHQAEQRALGYHLFNNRHITFLIETLPIILSTFFYTRSLPTRHQIPSLITLLATLIPQQLLFAYGSLPTWNSELVHGPMLLLTFALTWYIFRVIDLPLVDISSRGRRSSRAGIIAPNTVPGIDKSSVDSLTSTVKRNLHGDDSLTGKATATFRSLVGQTPAGAQKTEVKYAGAGKWKVEKGVDASLGQVVQSIQESEADIARAR
ncbi:hypothetical protein HK097_000615 [Rhizophlyctis rosea]|uniref:Uncharacterized protein n=1 Tax=Rhizophlyctis rosea TaxID=64517 RepID=A0AAD5X708_9FUNG|nr:hypothetical protein HK097_000615 [Rhizophlyctis rosea]